MMEGGRQLAMAILVLVATSGVLAESDNTKDTATREVLHLLADPDLYNKAIRPKVDGDATNVKVQTYVRDINIDDVNMEATFDITFRMIWMDDRLAYEGTQVEYVTVLDPNLAWLPDAFFKQARMTQYMAIYPERYLRVFPDGRLIFSSRISLKQSCEMDLGRFPHDVQTCSIQIASYGYTTKDLVFELAALSGVTFGDQLHSNRFSIEKYLTKDCNSKTSTGEYSCLELNLVVRRMFGAYLLEWYLPIIFLVIVAWFGFLVPATYFLARLVLTLIPMIAISSFCITYKASLASVPYVRAIDIFNGVSLFLVFCTLVHVIVCQVRGSKGQEEKKSDCPEDGEVKLEGEATGVRGLLNKFTQRASFLSRILIVGVYCFFLFVYFVAYCGTG